MGGTLIKVLVADDHAVVRRGLRQILAETTDIEVGAEASSGPEVLQALREHRAAAARKVLQTLQFDLVLVDCQCAGGRLSTELLDDLAARDDAPPTVVLALSIEASRIARRYDVPFVEPIGSDALETTFWRALRNGGSPGRAVETTTARGAAAG